MLDTNVAWDLQYFQLLANNTPIASVQPLVVPLKTLTNSEHFWPPRRAQRADKGRAKPKIVPHVAETAFMASWGCAALKDAAPSGQDVPADELEDATLHDLPDAPVEVMDEYDADLYDRSIETFLEEHAEELGNDTGFTCMDIAEASTEHVVPLDAHLGVSQPQDHDLSGSAQVGNPMDILAVAPPPNSASSGSAAVVPRLVGLRFPSDCIVHLDDGSKLSYYQSKASFEARCACAGHIACVLTRRGTGVLSKSKGRPLGFLMAWLMWGQQCSDKAAHRNKEKWKAELTLDVRKKARQTLLALTNGLELASHEREKDDDELSEPEDIKGYLS
eukprot:4076238-Amphidinium_carterae.1